MFYSVRVRRTYYCDLSEQCIGLGHSNLALLDKLRYVGFDLIRLRYLK